MKDISTQFHGAMTIPAFMVQFDNDVESIKNKVPYRDEASMQLSMWVVGPIEGKNGVFLWGANVHNPGSTQTEIISINRIGETRRIMVLAKDKRWYRLDLNDSAFSMAKAMDMLLHGHYTSIVLTSSDFVAD